MTEKPQFFTKDGKSLGREAARVNFAEPAGFAVPHLGKEIQIRLR